MRSVVEREVFRHDPSAVVGFGYDFGHTAPAVPLRLGSTATLRADGTLRFE